MTLSQTYISRKQLLVDNLVAKGVTGYTVNDGLTTLINAVLEIQGGGGVRTLTLTSDKDILSYADSESATLTATLLEDGVGVSGATVEFFNGSTSLGTAQTDSNGVATKTYTSTGAGDVSLKAEADNGMLVSKTFSIRDGIFYDVSSSGNVSKYGSSSAFSYDSTEQAYYITTSSAKNITRESVVGDFDFEVSMDFKIASIGTLFYVGESTSGYECQTEIAYQSSAKRVSTFYTNSSQSVNGRTVRTNYNFDTSKRYHLKVTRIGNVLTAQILDGDTIVATAIDNNVVGTNLNVAWHNYVAIGTMYWKNILFIRL